MASQSLLAAAAGVMISVLSLQVDTRSLAQPTNAKQPKTAVAIPRAPRIITNWRMVLGTRTLSEFMTNLDLAREGVPLSRIDPVQIGEIETLSRGIAFEPDDRVTLSTISGVDRNRQVVIEMSVYTSPRSRKFVFQLHEDGHYVLE